MSSVNVVVEGQVKEALLEKIGYTVPRPDGVTKIDAAFIKKANREKFKPIQRIEGKLQKHDVLMLTYGGAKKVFVVGDKLTIPKGEYRHIATRYPGLLRLVGSGAVSASEYEGVLLERNKELEDAASKAAAHARQVEEKNSDLRREIANSEAAHRETAKENADLKKQIATLEAKLAAAAEKTEKKDGKKPQE